MTTIKVIGFDLDDTLWEIEPVLLRAERILGSWLCEQVPGFRYDIDTMRAVRTELLEADPTLEGRVTELRRSVIEEGLYRAGVDRDTACTLSEDAMVVFLEARNDIELFEDVHDTITALSREFVCGVLTNGNADIERMGLANLFSFVFSAEQVGAAKPEDALFRAALEHTSVQPHEMVYVGDHPTLDIDPANRLGLRTIWVDNGIKQRDPGETEPDAVISHVREVPDVIRRL